MRVRENSRRRRFRPGAQVVAPGPGGRGGRFQTQGETRPDSSGLCLVGRLLVFFVQLELAGHLLLYIRWHSRVTRKLDGVTPLATGQRLQA